MGCGEEDAASEQGGKLVNYLRDRTAIRESRWVGEWILAEKIQELSTGVDASLLDALGRTLDEMGVPDFVPDF